MHEQNAAESSQVAFSLRKAKSENAREERERQRQATNERAVCERFKAEAQSRYEARMKAYARQ